MITLNSLLDKMWIDYCELNPAAARVYKLLSDKGETVINDHIALRTITHPKLGIESLAKTFKKLGYTEKKDYEFVEKKLYAKHYEHSDPNQPKIFISELQLHKLSSFVQKKMNEIAEQISDSQINSDDFSCCGRSWEIRYTDYEMLAAESEYAAWFSVHGFRPNHFTVNVNALKQFPTLASLNDYLESNGYTLNKSGGVIKGSPKDLLEQSSTMASEIPVKFQEGTQKVPGCYYEFAKRYPQQDGKLYTGFVAASADKIFESTNRLK